MCIEGKYCHTDQGQYVLKTNANFILSCPVLILHLYV